MEQQSNAQFVYNLQNALIEYKASTALVGQESVDNGQQGEVVEEQPAQEEEQQQQHHNLRPRHIRRVRSSDIYVSLPPSPVSSRSSSPEPTEQSVVKAVRVKKPKPPPKPRLSKRQRARFDPNLPDWIGYEHVCYFLRMPPEVLDLILSQPILTFSSHLYLSRVNKALRSCYFLSNTPRVPHEELWSSLKRFRPLILLGRVLHDYTCQSNALVNHIWSGSSNKPDVNDATQLVCKGTWQSCQEVIADELVSQTRAGELYAVSPMCLNPLLSCIEKNNPTSRHFAPMHLYSEVEVETVALRLYGGVQGFRDMIQKRAEKPKRKSAPRARAGRWDLGYHRGRYY